MASANIVERCSANNVRCGYLSGGTRSHLLVVGSSINLVKQGVEVSLAHELELTCG